VTDSKVESSAESVAEASSQNVPGHPKRVVRLLLILVTLAVGVVIGLWQLKPPPVDQSSPDYPAYQTMMANIERLAIEPHPAGSAADATVRAGVIDEISAMGLTPVVEDKTYTTTEIIDLVLPLTGWASAEEWWNHAKDNLPPELGIHDIATFLKYKAGVGDDGTLTIHNILVKLDAPGTDRGVMLIAHYDSTPKGPGAADDMVATCAVLEAMRAQAHNPDLQNDLYFLITDAEENGLVGASAFVAAHPDLSASIDAVANFEARGNRGGLMLFQTSPAAYSLVAAAQRSGAHPIGMSWMAWVYSMMPNNTDLTIFLNNGYQGINFAVVEGVENYHQPTDSFANLNQSTAWQYLRTALSLADYGASHSLANQSNQEAVFFVLLPRHMVVMPGLASTILGALICLVALAALVWDGRRKRLAIVRAIGRSLLIAVAVATLIVFPSGSFLFYLPLLALTITGLLAGKKIAHIVIAVLSGVLTLLLWVPVGFAAWVGLIQPMLL